MRIVWQQRVLFLVSALLTATPSPAFATSFITPTSATRSAPFNKSDHYNPLTQVSAGGDGSVSADNPEGGASDAVSDTTAPESSLLGPNAKAPGKLRSKFPKLPWHKLPDYLTFARCLAIPAFVALFYSKMNGKSHLYTGTIFALASITDWFDGFLARRWDISTACEYYGHHPSCSLRFYEKKVGTFDSF